MALLKSKKLRVGLGIFAGLLLIIVVTGFAWSRDYLIHFLYDEQTISRDDFLRNAYAPADQQMYMACAQGDWALGWLYLYEVHCFRSEPEMRAYMKAHFGS